MILEKEVDPNAAARGCVTSTLSEALSFQEVQE
jgi:hypothetical protein